MEISSDSTPILNYVSFIKALGTRTSAQTLHSRFDFFYQCISNNISTIKKQRYSLPGSIVVYCTLFIVILRVPKTHVVIGEDT